MSFRRNCHCGTSPAGARVTPEWDEDEEQYNEILKRIAPTTTI